MRDGWTQTTLGTVLESITDRAGEHGPELVLSVTEKRGIIPQQQVFKKRIATRDTSKYKVLRRFDIAFNPYLAWCGAVGQWLGDDAGVTSPVYECFRVRQGCDPRFIGLVLESGLLNSYFDATAVGSIQRRRRTTVPIFRSAPLLLPSCSDQRRIVDLIVAIDAQLATTHDVDEQVRESVRAVSGELICWTRSLRPLGEVATIESKLVDPTLDEYRALPHIGVDRMVSSEGTLLPLLSAEHDGVTSGKYLFDSSDVIYSKIRPELRKAAFPGSIGLSSADAYPLRPRSELLPEYLLEVLLSDSFTEQAVAKSGRTKMPKINRHELFAIEIPVLPPEEQQEVVDFIGSLRDVGRADRALNGVLIELRSTLLTSLLSGHLAIPESYDAMLVTSS